jgi:hypothetical protein
MNICGQSSMRREWSFLLVFSCRRGCVMLPLEMDKSFKSVNLLWTFLKGIWYEQATQTV